MSPSSYCWWICFTLFLSPSDAFVTLGSFVRGALRSSRSDTFYVASSDAMKRRLDTGYRPSNGRVRDVHIRLHPMYAAADTGVELRRGTAAAAGEDILDVAIVGAGPAGLALAVGLKEKGLRVKVFEAAPEIKERGAAVFLQVRVSFDGVRACSCARSPAASLACASSSERRRMVLLLFKNSNIVKRDAARILL